MKFYKISIGFCLFLLLASCWGQVLNGKLKITKGTPGYTNGNIPEKKIVQSHIVVASEDNTIAVIDSLFLEKPLQMKGGVPLDMRQVVKLDLVYKPWWRTLMTFEHFDQMPYSEVRKFISDEYAKLMSKEDYSSTIKARKKNGLIGKMPYSVCYYVHFKYKEDEYVLIGGGQKMIKQVPENCSVTVLKVVDDKWVIHTYEAGNIIFDLPFSYPERLKKIIKHKLVKQYSKTDKSLQILN